MRHISILAALALGACAPSQSTPTSARSTATPAAQVYAAKNAYAALLTAAVAYNGLPRCPQPAPALCSDPAAVTSLRAANATAISALGTAETIVRSGTGPAVLFAAQTAVQAVATFQALVSQYKGG